MTYADIRRAVLELINQYSAAGETISPAYNNQSDTIHRIPNLINQALLKIRTETRPDRTSVRLSGGMIQDGFALYSMPEDCWRIVSGGVFRMDGGSLTPCTGCRILGQRSILLPARDGNAFLVEYLRYPEQLPADPPDAYETREDPDVLAAAVYYAAAFLVMDDSPYTYSALYNEFEARIRLMSPGLTAELHPIGEVCVWPS